MGSALIFMASQAWMRGDLTGSGPVDRQKRQAWLDAGYRQDEITVGGISFNHTSIEPFSSILQTVANIGDASQLMGPEWTEKNLLKVSLLIAQGLTSKSYLAGMQQFVDLVGGRPGQISRIAGNLANNIVPLGGLRNELGKLFNPHLRELNSGIFDAIRNRNLLSERVASEPLPLKYDLLNGQPIKDHDPITRMWNAVSPINFNFTHSPGRTLLFNSGYDLRQSTYYAPDGTNLTDSPRIRSQFQKAIGDQNLELKLNKLARNKKILASLEQMQKDIQSGQRADFQPRDYYHNKVIDNLFRDGRRIAWASIMNETNIREEVEKQRKQKVKRQLKTQETANILNMYK